MMQKKKAAVFCSRGLGDALLFAIIGNNLVKNGYQVTIFHDFLDQLYDWMFPCDILPYPQEDNNLHALLEEYTLLVINGDDRRISQKIVQIAKTYYSKKTYVLFPTTCKGKNLPGDFLFDREKSMVQNLVFFCQDVLKLKNVVCDNGINAPSSLIYAKHEKRVILHTWAATSHRRWPLKKFLLLAKKIKKIGYEPVFFMTPKEAAENDFPITGFPVVIVKNLQELAKLIYEASFFVGNDSGVGHLASCLKIPTVSIFSSKRKKGLWRPDWYKNQAVVPYSIVPNIKGLRMRQRCWKSLIEVSRVFFHIKKIIQYKN